eukprot:TRINITY_DN9206_c0_g1_i3.p1 TRINITY_DN9206_c0_g1~~TRINITY_DN9206_c0_g1_i3.p1  ORF type:complete len:200 (+),score=26.35 TRINITY_DN9206_c0_g1_i3:71-670(+)
MRNKAVSELSYKCRKCVGRLRLLQSRQRHSKSNNSNRQINKNQGGNQVGGSTQQMVDCSPLKELALSLKKFSDKKSSQKVAQEAGDLSPLSACIKVSRLSDSELVPSDVVNDSATLVENQSQQCKFQAELSPINDRKVKDTKLAKGKLEEQQTNTLEREKNMEADVVIKSQKEIVGQQSSKNKEVNLSEEHQKDRKSTR